MHRNENWTYFSRWYDQKIEALMASTAVWVGWSRVWFSAGARDFALIQNIQTDSGVHPPHLFSEYCGSFLGTWCWPFASISSWSEEWVELYLPSPIGLCGMERYSFTFSTFYVMKLLWVHVTSAQIFSGTAWVAQPMLLYLYWTGRQWSVCKLSPHMCKHGGCNHSFSSLCPPRKFWQNGGQWWYINIFMYPQKKKWHSVRSGKWGGQLMVPSASPFPWKLSVQEVLYCYMKMLRCSILLE